jgi:hypothetical protein
MLRSFKYSEWLVLGMVFMVASVLRLSFPEVIEFKRDEANLSLLALELARGEHFPLLGILSSVGIPNSPISVYLFAIPYFFSSNPVIATLFVGVLNVLTVLLVYLLVRRYYAWWVAGLAALLYAVSPWAIIYSRKIWAQNLLPVFVVGLLFVAVIGLLDRKRWAQILILPLLSLVAQIHYSGVFLIVPIAYLLWMKRANITKYLWLGGLIGILFALPFGVGLLQSNWGSLGSIGGGGERSISLTDDTLSYMAMNISGTDIHSLAGERAFEDYLNTIPKFSYMLFNLLPLATLIAGIGLMIYRLRKPSSAPQIVVDVLLLTLITVILVFSITWTTPYPHYLLLILPIAYMVLAIGIGQLWDTLNEHQPLRRGLFCVLGVVMMVIMVMQATAWFKLIDFLNHNPTSGAFGTPLAYILPIQQYILDQKPSQVIGYLDGQFIGMDDESTVWDFLLKDVANRRFLDDQTWVYPAEGALSLHDDCQQATGETFGLRPDEGCYQVTEQLLPNQERWQPLDVVLDNGASFTGYQWGALDGCLWVRWSIERPTDQNYSLMVHFLDAEGHVIYNADALSLLGRYWQAGDTVVRRFCIPDEALIQATVGVQLGMYLYDGSQFFNANVLSGGDGQSITVDFKSID